MFTSTLLLSLKKLPNSPILPSFSKLLNKDETVIGNFMAKGAFITFTDRRLLIDSSAKENAFSRNIENTQIIPYRSISLCTLRTDDLTQEIFMGLTILGVGYMSLFFQDDIDITHMCNHITSSM